MVSVKQIKDYIKERVEEINLKNKYHINDNDIKEIIAAYDIKDIEDLEDVILTDLSYLSIDLEEIYINKEGITFKYWCINAFGTGEDSKYNHYIIIKLDDKLNIEEITIKDVDYKLKDLDVYDLLKLINLIQTNTLEYLDKSLLLSKIERFINDNY